LRQNTFSDDRLKRAGGGNYFDELLARIRWVAQMRNCVPR